MTILMTATVDETVTATTARVLATCPSALGADRRADAGDGLARHEEDAPQPEQLFDVTIQPMLFTAMFAYIFGGAISGNVQDYLPIIIPGILAQTVLTACIATGVQLREDMDKGVFDRFRSLPIARIAPLAGPMVADTAALRDRRHADLRHRHASWATGPAAACSACSPAVVLAIIAGWSLAWIFAWFGHDRPQRQGVQGISMMIMFPLTFLSNAFVPDRHAARLAADLRRHQPGHPRGDRHPRPGQQRRRSPPRSAGRCSAAPSWSRSSRRSRCGPTAARCELTERGRSSDGPGLRQEVRAAGGRRTPPGAGQPAGQPHARPPRRRAPQVQRDRRSAA